MGRFDDKTAISTIADGDILPITDISDDADDKKISMTQIKTFCATDITGKQDLVDSATIDNLASFDTDGQVEDSGIALGDVTAQGNTFNGASQLVQMTSETKLPAVDGSLLTGLERGIVDLGTATSGTKTCSYMDATYTLIANGAFTLSLPTEAVTTVTRLIRIKLTMVSINTITFPASVKWLNNLNPNSNFLTSTTATYILTFITEDGGTSWEGSCSTFGV